MTINNRPFPSIKQVQNERQVTSPRKSQGNVQGTPFQNILQQQMLQKDSVRFSKHANARLASRQINLSDEQIARLSTGVDKAMDKGIRESLMLMDNIALVVNVENRTVVTALDQTEAKEHVFTNIDGAVLL